MYTQISAIRLVLKEFQLPKRLWDEIVQAVAYVKYCTISQSTNGITPYKGINKSVLFVAHLRAFRWQCYVHVSDIIIYQTMHDCGWKSIMVEYRGVNQWRVYNLKTRKIHILSFVHFDKGFSYYDINCEATDKDDESRELGNIQNEVDDNEFSKAMARKQVARREVTLADPIP